MLSNLISDLFMFLQVFTMLRNEFPLFAMCTVCNKIKRIIYCLIFPIRLKIDQGENPSAMFRFHGYSCDEIKILFYKIKLDYHEYKC